MKPPKKEVRYSVSQIKPVLYCMYKEPSKGRRKKPGLKHKSGPNEHISQIFSSKYRYFRFRMFYMQPTS